MRYKCQSIVALSFVQVWRRVCFPNRCETDVIQRGPRRRRRRRPRGFRKWRRRPAPPAKEWAARNDALTRARVFRDEPFDAASIDFAVDPNSGVVDSTLTSLQIQAGRSQRHDAEVRLRARQNGEKIKVKYGYTQEIPSEIAATRLLHGLGFGADRVIARRDSAVLRLPISAVPHTRALGSSSSTEFFDKRRDYASIATSIR